jgi:predicted PurR-regulated permease PerM
MNNTTSRLVFDISWSAIWKILAVVVGIWLVFTLKDFLILLFFVFIFIGTVNPTITLWQKRMPRVVAVFLVYAIVLAAIAILAYLVFPPLIAQVNDLFHSLPNLIKSFGNKLQSVRTPQTAPYIDRFLSEMSGGLNGVGAGFFNTTAGVVTIVAGFITGVVLSFYMLLEERNARLFFNQVLPYDKYDVLYLMITQIADRMGSWMRGQIALMLALAVANYITYLVIGVPSALALAVWAGLCEAVPYVGPFLGVVPGLILAIMNGSVLQVILVLALNLLLLHQLESNILAPKIMSKAIGLSPVLVIISLIVGTELFGMVGAVIAVPVAAALSVVFAHWTEIRKLWEQPELIKEI